MPLLRRALQTSLGRRLPVVDGALTIPGIDAPVTIRRDAFSVPYIEAQNDADAWFGLGFCQGQDRAFQLELRLRMVRGTLSRLIGAPGLPFDRLARRVGLHYASTLQLPVLAPDVRATVEAFARGINAGFEVGSRGRAHEFVLLRTRPTRWTAADVLGAGKLMSLFLIGNWDVELARLKILMSDGEQALRDLDPAYPAHHVVTAPPNTLAGPAIDRLSEDLARVRDLAGGTSGSNNWVIAGSRTATGRPLLANDPHLDPTLPAHWYLAHVRTPEWTAVGASLIAAPGIGVGHNGTAAWGVTAALTDTVDLFIEEVGADGRSVRQSGTFVPCEVRREVIAVKGAADVVEDVLMTPRGPIVGPALEGEVGALSMSAVWLQPLPARGFLTSHRTTSFESFRREFADWPVLPQNLVYADTSGDIGWQLVGQLPERKQGYGTLPQRGSDPNAGWHDTLVPFDAMPHTLNPQAGYLATANNKPIADLAAETIQPVFNPAHSEAHPEPGRKAPEEGARRSNDRPPPSGATPKPPYLGLDWLDGYRIGRIIEALARDDGWTLEACRDLQLDSTTLAWRELQPALESLPRQQADARLALEYFDAWDGHLSSDSTTATIYELFLAEIWRRVVIARAPNSAEYALGKGFTPLLPLTTFAAGRLGHLIELLNRQPDGWFAHGWPAELTDALTTVVQRLRMQHGNDPAAWHYGSLRKLTLEHPIGRIPQFTGTFNRGPYEYGGDGTTVSQAGTTALKPLGNPTAIASLRAVIDVGSWEDARFILPGGQSGNPLSPHYDDQLPHWLNGEGIPIAFSTIEVGFATQHTLRLSPLRR